MMFMPKKMLSWMKKKPKPIPDKDLMITALVRRGGEVKQVEVLVVGTVAMNLRAVDFDGSGELLLTENQVIDQDHFWRLWKQFNRDTILEWEE